jgi:hypothetical protein
MNAAIRLISSADRTSRPTLGDALDQPAEGVGGRRDVLEPGPLQGDRAVILRELGEPQLAGDVRAIEVERLEPLRPDALDVPAMKELVRDGVEEVAARWRSSRPT